MKILYDSQIFGMQDFGGISRYFYNLIKFRNNNNLYDISGIYSTNVYAKEISSLKSFPIKQSFKGKKRLINYINFTNDFFSIKREKYDIFHPTYYAPVEFPPKKPMVVTVHDMIQETFPGEFPYFKSISQNKLNIINKADQIIAISLSTANDILKFCPKVSEKKINVVYHSIDWNGEGRHLFTETPPARPYILFTGQRTGYKNFSTFLDAISDLLLKYDICLYCTGLPFNQKETAHINNMNLSSRVFSLFVDENSLQYLYENALCFVFPSLYEGFGLPILEAFISNCPVILSNSSCFPEIAKDAAIYFNPISKEDMKEKINYVLCSPSIRDKLRYKGKLRLINFTMDNFIKNTYKVYSKVLSDH